MGAGHDPMAIPTNEADPEQGHTVEALARRLAVQSARLVALEEITAALGLARAPEDVATAVMRVAAGALGANIGGVRLLSEDGTQLDNLPAPGYHPVLSQPLLEGPIGPPSPQADAARSGEPIWIETPEEGIARYPETAALVIPHNILAAISLPLRVEGRITGTLSFGFAQPRAFAADERDFLQVVAGLTAQALERSRAYMVAQERAAAAEELARLRGDFVAAVSHDLRTPLTAIRGRVQIVQRELERMELPETAPLVDQLGRTLARADGMLALIRELGEVARVGLGVALDLQPRPTDLAALVREAIEAQHVVSGRTIELEVRPGELWANVDPERVGRVVGNLLANAVKYSPPDAAIQVRLGSEEGPGGPQAVLQVCDEGIGIPAADLPHIFERFRRGSNVAGLAEGAGVGLASARAIVEQHGGRITVESVEGEGSTFTVRLPLALR